MMERVFSSVNNKPCRRCRLITVSMMRKNIRFSLLVLLFLIGAVIFVINPSYGNIRLNRGVTNKIVVSHIEIRDSNKFIDSVSFDRKRVSKNHDDVAFMGNIDAKNYNMVRINKPSASNRNKNVKNYNAVSSKDRGAKNYNMVAFDGNRESNKYYLQMSFSHFKRSNVTTIMSRPPPPKVPNLKSPCWKTGAHGSKLDCLPAVYIAGFTKSGTSDLYYRLQRHPQVITGCNKESHYWNKIGYSQPISKYFRCHSNLSSVYSAWSEKNSHSAPPNVLSVDASPSTIWRRFKEFVPMGDIFETATVIRHVLPDSKFIVLMRNPVDRLYSGYQFFSRFKNPTPEHFHSIVMKGVPVFNECSEKNKLKHCIYHTEKGYSSDHIEPEVNYILSLAIGMYWFFIDNWVQYFPTSQLHLIHFEDYKKDIAGHLRNVFDFIEIDQPGDKIFSEMVNMDISNNNTYLPMLQETRDMLDQFYRPHNIRLSHLLKDKRFLWT